MLRGYIRRSSFSSDKRPDRTCPRLTSTFSPVINSVVSPNGKAAIKIIHNFFIFSGTTLQITVSEPAEWVKNMVRLCVGLRLLSPFYFFSHSTVSKLNEHL